MLSFFITLSESQLLEIIPDDMRQGHLTPLPEIFALSLGNLDEFNRLNLSVRQYNFFWNNHGKFLEWKGIIEKNDGYSICQQEPTYVFIFAIGE